MTVLTGRPPLAGEPHEAPDDLEALFEKLGGDEESDGVVGRRCRPHPSGGGGGHRRRSRGTGRPATTPGHPKAAASSPSGGRGASVAGRYSVVQSIGVADDDVAWAASETGIFVTTDGGERGARSPRRISITTLLPNTSVRWMPSGKTNWGWSWWTSPVWCLLPIDERIGSGGRYRSLDQWRPDMEFSCATGLHPILRRCLVRELRRPRPRFRRQGRT